MKRFIQFLLENLDMVSAMKKKHADVRDAAAEYGNKFHQKRKAWGR